MYCKKCGKEIPDNSVYCNHCGTRQTPKKIVVEFNEPSLPSINGDSVRSGIFKLGRCFKKWIIQLKPLVLRLLFVAVVTGASYGISYLSYYYFNKPEEANVLEINHYISKGIIAEEVPVWLPSGKKTDETWTIYSYKNPSTIITTCKWDFDDDMIKNATYWFKESNNINVARKKYLESRTENFAIEICLIAFGLCLIYYLIKLYIKFKKWLYKK